MTTIPPQRDLAALAARVLIAGLFLGGAAQKSLDPGAAQALLAAWGLPMVLVWPALLFNGICGILLMIGRYVRPVAGLLALYCAATSLFHWVPDDPWQISIFVKNWAVAGGCLALYGLGAGRWSLDGP